MSKIEQVVEKYYSVRELQTLIGFNEKWWRERAQEGAFDLRDQAGNLVSQAVELGGELRIPASAVNAYVLRHPYRYDAGVRAANREELRRQLAREPKAVAA